jgi:hypothetical protein
MKKKTTSAPSAKKARKTPTRDLSPLEKKSSSIKAGAIKRRAIRR